MSALVQALLKRGATVLAVDREGHTPALACAPNKDVADCLALILATMGRFPVASDRCPRGLKLPLNCGILAKAVSGETVSSYGAARAGSGRARTPVTAGLRGGGRGTDGWCDRVTGEYYMRLFY
ncbi:serine/threonine-protein phosphatase 6 regulatory ankyrin repeat subunit C-like [Leucoraja erinacea]|uniref:serine/threonine-protein phosphatase 6 regulatory ankyrin repeat subunit C-like n=1 Tax=Leucoraja erinaceus TaxID=7782 RepID=UPI0024545334|nr:serine/threonine-protein phosphatase 6 regulatory ankyrin repeat subunit C-like [Leucoraja erinacea]